MNNEASLPKNMIMKVKAVTEAAKMAAKIYENRDWHKLTMRECDLVKYLERANLLEPSEAGFVGKAI